MAMDISNMLIKLLTTPVKQLMKELKGSPWTLLAITLLLVGTYIETITYAKAVDLEIVSRQATANEAKLERILLLTTAESIRSVVDELCKAKDPNPALQRILDGLQADYLKNQGVYYPARGCS